MTVVPDPLDVILQTPAIVERGARELRASIMGFLELAMPPALAASRALWELTDEQLPDPVSYDPYESEVTDETPALTLGLTRSRNYGRTDLDYAVGAEYSVRYTARVYTWVTADAPDDADARESEQNPTLQLRDDYAQVALGCLLSTPSLLRTDTMVLEETAEVAWGDAARLRGDRRMAGASLTFDVVHTERIRRVLLGSANTLLAEATVLSEND